LAIEKVARAMSWSVVARVTRFTSGLIANIIIVRSLGAHDWGILSVVKSFVGFAFVIIMMGLGNALLKFTPAVRVKGDISQFTREFKKLVVLQVVVWVLLLVIIAIFSDGINSIYGGQFERFSYYLIFAIGFVLFEVFMVLITNLLQSWYETRMLAVVILYSNIGYLAILVLFIKLGLGIVGILAAGGIVNLCASLLLIPEIRKLTAGADTAVSKNSPGAGRILKFSLPFVVTGFLNQIVWRQSEVIFLGHYHGAKFAGYFGLAYRLPQLLLEFIPLTIWPLVLAGTSEMYAKDSESLGKSINLYYRLLYILVIPVSAIGFAVSRGIIPLVYGEQMMPSAVFAQLFFIVFSYSFLYTPLSLALYVLEKSWVNMIIFLILAVINVGLDFALIPRYGLWGAFAPVSIVLALGVVLFRFSITRFRKDVKIPIDFIGRCYISAIPAFALGIVTVRFRSPLMLGLELILAVILIYAGFRLMGIIGEEEKELILRLPIPMKEKIVALF